MGCFQLEYREIYTIGSLYSFGLYYQFSVFSNISRDFKSILSKICYANMKVKAGKPQRVVKKTRHQENSRPHERRRENDSSILSSVPLLYYPENGRPGNFQVFKKAFHEYCQATYGKVSSIISTERDYVPERPRLPGETRQRNPQVTADSDSSSDDTSEAGDDEGNDEHNAVGTTEPPAVVPRIRAPRLRRQRRSTHIAEDGADNDFTASGTSSNAQQHASSGEGHGDLPNVGDEINRLILAEQVKEYAREVIAVKKKKELMYGALKTRLSDSSIARLKEAPRWQEIEDNMDFLRLWKLIVKTHHTRGEKATDIAKFECRDYYHEMKQKEREGLGAFKERFLRQISLMKSMKVTVPSESEQVVDFLTKLDPRYDEIRRDLHRDAVRGIKAFPDKLSRLQRIITDYDIRGSAPSFTQNSVFHTKGDAPSGKNRVSAKGNKPNVDNPQARPGNPQQQEKRCWGCGEAGHFKNNCPKAKKKALSAGKGGKSGDNVVHLTTSEGTLDDLDDAVFHCVEVFNIGKGYNALDVLLDNASSIHIFRNKDLLTNVRPAGVPLKVGGIGKSTITASMTGEFHPFGTVYYDKGATANILSMARVRDQHFVKYDYDEDTFVVEASNGQSYSFERSGKYYVYTPTVSVNIQTVVEQEARYTKREVADARAARRAMQALGHASAKDVAAMLKSGAIANAPFTVQDLARAASIWGADVGSLKGKAKERKADPVKTEYVPRQTPKHQTLMADIMFVEGDPYLVSVSKPLGLTLVNHLKGSRSASTLMAAISNQLNRYTAQGFVVKTILTDGEGGLMSLEAYLNGEGISVNPAGPGQHVPVVENKIRQIKERCRAVINTLPYTLPANLLKWLVMFSVSRLNMLPCGTRVDTTSPREIFTGRKLDFKRDLKLCFGEYVQAKNPAVQKNSLAARTDGCIVMLPTNNIQGSVRMYSLRTKSIVTRDRFTLLPMPTEVIDHMNREASRQKRKVSEEPQFRLRDRSVEQIRQWSETAAVQPEQPLLQQEPRPDIDDIAVDSSDGESESESENYNGASDHEEVIQAIPAANDDAPAAADVDDPSANEAEAPPVGADCPAGMDEPGPCVVATTSVKRARGKDSIHDDRPAKRENSSALGLTLIVHEEVPCIFNISVREAVRKHGTTATESIRKELQQMEDKEVWEPLTLDTLRERPGKKIASKMFLKEKFKADGSFEKLKSRFVAGGHQQDRTIYDDLSSPAVSMTSLFIILAIAATEKRCVISVDVPGAYLNTDIEKRVYMRIAKDIADIMVEMNPSKYRKCQLADGSIIVLLKKALYGCVEAALLWYEHLRSTIEAAGFQRNGYDRCVFNRVEDGVQTTICVYVDDLLITSTDESHAQRAVEILRKRYGELSVNEGNQHSYLGMMIDFDRKARLVNIGMSKYIEDILDIMWDGGSAASPAALNLFNTDKGTLLDKEKSHEFHSRVARILYLAKRVRPDLLLTVSFLSSRVQLATTQDWDKLMRLVRYLACTKAEQLTLGADRPYRVIVYIDSSFAVHSDGKGQTGVFLTFGRGAIYACSEKQRFVARSSCECELYGDSDGLTPALGARNFTEAQGYKQQPAMVMQDNLSTITMANKGCSTSKRTRHINIRELWIHDKIRLGECVMQHCRTNIMVADALTKPTQGSLLRWQRSMLLGCEPVPTLPPTQCGGGAAGEETA